MSETATGIDMIRLEGEGLLVTVERKDGTVSTYTMSDEEFERLRQALNG